MSRTTFDSYIQTLAAVAAGYRRAVAFSVNLTVAAVCFAAAALLHHDFRAPAEPPFGWAVALSIVLTSKAVCFSAAGLNEGWWRFIGIRDVPRFVVGSGAASGLLIVLSLLKPNIVGLSVGLLLTDLSLCLSGLLGTRILSRLMMEGVRRAPNSDSRLRRLLVIGAGRMGARLVDELYTSGSASYELVGLVDDDPYKVGSRIRGTEVLGTTADLDSLLSERKITDVVIALTAPDEQWLRGVKKVCDESTVKCRILPTFGEYLSGKASLGQIRDIRLEDLLGRAPVRLDERSLASGLNGKVVLITGGAGSIGSELCRQIARFGPKRLLLLDKDESGIYFMKHELQRRFPSLQLVTIICDIRNAQRLRKLFQKYQIEAVFHAAAYKHVPLMEENVYEAVSTNVYGTLLLARLARESGCEKFVLISTDKAVKPCSVMGATKRAAELVLETIPNGQITYVAVRFGNVLGSAGSVVPLFQRQIALGGPVTVTHPEVTRYFMTVQEAVQLVLHASTLAKCKDLFMLDMGKPVPILELAENLIRLNGLEPNVDVSIEFSGLRPGEKLHEELLLKSEGFEPTTLPKVLRVRTKCTEPAWLAEKFQRFEELLQKGDDNSLLDWLTKCVAEYRPGSTPQPKLKTVPFSETDLPTVSVRRRDPVKATASAEAEVLTKSAG